LPAVEQIHPIFVSVSMSEFHLPDEIIESNF